ncbi:protein NETWORKED 4B-like [Vicia villosa]|uniref:protein NETWORKED 4B-like n=1 Tax=Vicia villosa TaxID=3911 RepID=UPI00273B104A|nr:protein NETWORKED 4B-like [Vicia villosa]
MAEITMKNQPSKPHWWWLDEHTSARRSPWLQSTLTELNEKTKAMLKLIEEDADSFAQRAEMFYKKRPELVSMVEDFYKIHRLLAERYDQVRPEAGTRLLPPSACLKHSQSEKWTNFDYRCYDSYSENCDVEESVESEIDDPEQEGEVRPVAPNEVMKLFERVGEVKKTDKDQIKQKDDVLDEVMMLREEIDRLRKENEAYKNELAQKNTTYNEVVTNLREEIEQLKKINKTTKDEIQQKNITRSEVMKLKKEIERLRKENEAQKEELKKKDSNSNEVMKLREEIKRLTKENEAQKEELEKKDTNGNEVMELRKELERHKKENEAQKEELEKNDSIHNEVMKLRKELERHKEEKKAQNDELKHKDTIRDEINTLKEERESFREENRTHKDDLKRKDSEKIEVIRQLSSTIDLLKQENIEMKNFIAKESVKKWKTPFEFDKLIETFSVKLFKGGPRRNKPSVVAL